MSRTYNYEWVKVRERVLRNAQICHLCGGLLDRDAPPRSPDSPSVDHIIPIKAMRTLDPRTRERLRLDLANLRPVHYRCNSARGAGRPRPVHTSKPWR
jgi:5-methylcytosine-specific restriction endonuclease McrA